MDHSNKHQTNGTIDDPERPSRTKDVQERTSKGEIRRDQSTVGLKAGFLKKSSVIYVVVLIIILIIMTSVIINTASAASAL